MPEYIATDAQYKTIQGDMWDIIALREYKDEHAMNWMQDANFDQRFIDMFPASLILQVPPIVEVQYNLKSGVGLPSINEILPWR
jgi:hypothetical protein